MSPRVPALAVVLLALLALGAASVAAAGGATGADAAGTDATGAYSAGADATGADAAGWTTVDGTTADAVTPAGVAAQQTTPTNGTLPTEETVIEARLERNGSATWRITEHVVITDGHERAAFDDLAQDFEARTAGSLGLQTFRESAEQAVEHADREMEIADVNHTASRESGSFEDTRYLNGTYTLTFRWEDFARVVEEDEGGDVVTYAVDDAFNTSTGTWLPGLTTNERLVIRFPARATTPDTPASVQDQAMQWQGPREFAPGYLTMVYQTPTTPAGTGDIVWAALGIAALALVIAGVLLARRRGVDPAAVIGGLGSEDETQADDEPDAAPAAEASAAAAEDDEEDLELLSDEERVERLLEDSGGRMKQANIVKETGWSNAKVSQLLSAMEEEGRITKLRIGRENLIAFPDEDVGEFET